MKLYEFLKFVNENSESTKNQYRMAKDLGLNDAKLISYIGSSIQVHGTLQDGDEGKLELTDKGREFLELVEYAEKWLG
jgi:predicted transcriptional regulator